jgi:hypothetical protein
MSLLSCVTELLTCPFHFEHEIEGGLMLDRTLFIRIAEARADQAEVEASALGDFGSG